MGSLFIFFKMRRGYSRYFVVTRVNPREGDTDKFLSSCDSIKASWYGYCVKDTKNGKKVMRGFFVLSGPPSFPRQLESWFPNFLIMKMPVTMEMDSLCQVPRDSGLIVCGEHHLIDVRINLFGLKELG
jgi:hypothetical protein